MKILVLQGVPASGKSTFAREFVKTNKNYVIVSRDSIRDSRGDYWIRNQENYISDVEEFQIKAAINRKLNVIIDATNLNPKTIAKWNNLAKELNCEIEYKLFEIDYPEAIKRNNHRKEQGLRHVGNGVLKSFFYKYFPNKIYKTDDRKMLVQDKNLDDCIIVDLDGTIAIHQSGRSPYDLNRVNEDTCDHRLQELIKLITKPRPTYNSVQLIFLSGREGTKECKKLTEEWLKIHFPYDKYQLLMRKEKDMRGDEIVKKEIYEEYIKGKYNVLAVFDDRDKVVKMWRDEGLLCCQVYYGDF